MTTANSELNKPSFAKKFRAYGWKHIVAWVVISITTFPILYIISASLIADGGLGTSTLFSSFTLANYVELFNDPLRPFGKWYWNTFYISMVASLGGVFISALGAYAFSRLRFRGRRGGLMTLLLMQMFPSILGLVAVYGILAALGQVFPILGLNSHLGLIMVYLGGALGAGTYLIYGFFNTIPKELDEAATIDGASHARIYFTIILRLAAPILAVMMLLNFIGTSSDFILASIVLGDPDTLTLATGLKAFISDPYSKDWSLFAAGTVLSAIPIVALFFWLQKYIVSGLTGGAVKG